MLKNSGITRVPRGAAEFYHLARKSRTGNQIAGNFSVCMAKPAIEQPAKPAVQAPSAAPVPAQQAAPTKVRSSRQGSDAGAATINRNLRHQRQPHRHGLFGAGAFGYGCG
jgi:hypothetical protein